MKKNSVIKICLICLFTIFLIAAVIFLKPNSTGFVALQTAKEPAQKETVQQEKNEQGKISTTLSFEIVQPTELDVNAVKTGIEKCPQYVSVVFEVRNTGGSAAERLFAEASSNLKVLDCLNCSAKQLKPNEKIRVALRACKTTEETAYIKFYSINAKEKRIEI